VKYTTLIYKKKKKSVKNSGFFLAAHLSGPLDALPDAEVAHDPHEQQSAGQLPPDGANVLDALGDLERTTSAKK
jgi:hypothetical protein